MAVVRGDTGAVVVRHVRSGRLELSVPMRPGSWSLPGPLGCDVLLEVPSGSRLDLLVTLDRSSGRLRIAKASARFPSPLRIRNPSRALQPGKGVLAPLVDKLKDLLADAVIEELHFDDTGALTATGHVEILRRFWLKLPFNSDVRLELDVQRLIDGSPSSAAAGARSTPPSPPIRIDALLARLGAIAAPGKLALRIESEPIAVRDPRLEVHGPDPEVVAAVSGTLRITPSGVIELTLPRDSGPVLASRLAAVELSGELSAQVDPRGQWTLQMSPEVRLALGDAELAVVPAEGVRVPLSVSRAANHIESSGRLRVAGGALALEGATAAVALCTSIGATEPVRISKLRLSPQDSAVQASARGRVVLRGTSVRVEEADLQVSVTTGDIDASYGPFSGRLDAHLAIGLRGDHVWLGTQPLAAGGSFALRVGVAPQGKGGGIVPRLPSVDREITFDLQPGGALAVGSPFGLLEAMIDPLFEVAASGDPIVPAEGPAAGAPGSAALLARLAEVSGAPVRRGDRVAVILDGAVSFARRLELVASATRSVCVMTPKLAADDAGTAIANALAAAAARGCKVRVIVDALGNLTRLDDLGAGNPLYAKLRAAGVELGLYNDPVSAHLGELLEDVSIVPELQGDSLQDLRALENPLTAVSIFRKLTQAATGRTAVAPEVRTRVAAALDRLLRATSAYSRRTSGEDLSLPEGSGPLGIHELLYAVRQTVGINHRWHQKLLVVDDRIAMLGSSDLCVESAAAGAREADLVLAGAGVADVRAGFAAAWQRLTGAALPPADPGGPAAVPPDLQPVDLQVVWHDLRELGDHRIINATIEVVRALGAGERAWIACSKFLPIGPLSAYKEALVAAARRGVDVRILTNSEDTSDLPEINRAAVFVYRELLAAGAKIYEGVTRPQIHARVTLLGGKSALLGSWSPNNRSESLYAELVAIVHGEAVVQLLEEVFRRAIAPEVAREITADSVAHQPMATELRSLAASAVGGLL
jgi:phosphatidylserine/phosphatidylglycerophosphate/cardiolipin synthase-like enzyme